MNSTVTTRPALHRTARTIAGLLVAGLALGALPGAAQAASSAAAPPATPPAATYPAGTSPAAVPAPGPSPTAEPSAAASPAAPTATTEGTWDQLQAAAAEDGTVAVVAMLRAPKETGATPEGRAHGFTKARDRLVGQFRGKKPKAFRALPGAPFIALHADAADLTTLRGSTEVTEVFADVVFDMAGTTSHGGAPGVQLQNWWHQTQLGTTWTLPNGWTGRGQQVVIIDTGVDRAHPWLSGRVVNEACFSTNTDGTGGCPGGATYSYSGSGAGVIGASAACTYSTGCAHGTHVAAIAAGKYGVAPDARIVAIQASHPEWDPAVGAWVPKFGWSDLANALWYVHGPLPTVPAAVNLSIGGGAYTGYCDTTNATMRNLSNWFIALKRDYGITTVVASGNDNYGNAVGAPACLSTAVSVGNSTLTTAGYDAVLGYTRGGSNSNGTLDLLAPGTDICSAVPVALDADGVRDGSDCSYSGTSMAAPQVAGAIAVLRQSRPGATSDAMVSALQRRGTAVVDDRNGITRTRINVANAVRYW